MEVTALEKQVPSEFRAKGHAFVLLICLASVVFSAVIFAIIRLPMGRTDFGITSADILRAAGFAMLLMISLSYAVLGAWRAWTVVSVPVVLGGVLLGLGAILPLVADAVLLGLLVFYARPLLQMKIGSWGYYALGLGVALLLSLAQIFTLLQTNYAPPLAFEQALLGILKQDTLFHATLAGMSTKYGIVSHGIDGLTAFNYHVFSHKLFSAFAAWSDIPVLMSYSLFFVVVFLPVMTFLLLINIVAARRLSDNVGNPFVAVSAALALMIAVTLLVAWSFWFSESAVLGNWFVLLGILLLGLVTKDAENWKDPRIAIVLMIFILFAALSKISAGGILAGGVFFWYLASAGKSWRGIVLATFVAVLPLLIVFLFTFLDRVQNNSYGQGTFGFLRLYLVSPQYVVPIVGFAFFLAKSYRSDTSANPSEAALRLAVVAMLALSATTTAILMLPGKSEGYFYGPGIWAAMAYFMRDGGIGLFLQKRAEIFRLATVMLLILLPILQSKALAKGGQRLEKNMALMQAVAAPMSTDSLLENTVLGQIFLAAQADPTLDAVNVSPRVGAFWDGRKPCWIPSLSVQALTSLPMIAGAPPLDRDCQTSPFYGFAAYDPVMSAARDFTDSALCSRATELGFDRVLKVEETLRTIDCEK